MEKAAKTTFIRKTRTYKVDEIDGWSQKKLQKIVKHKIAKRVFIGPQFSFVNELNLKYQICKTTQKMLSHATQNFEH